MYWKQSIPSETLEIVDSRFSDTKVKELLKHLPGTLHTLNLDGNDLTDNSIRELALSLKDFHMFSYLSLKRNKITGNFNSIKLLASTMASNRHFHYLDLSNNPINEQYFMEILQLESLEYLAFDRYKLLNNEYFLAKLRQSFTKLQCLHLCKNLHQSRPTTINENMTDDTMYPDYNITEELALCTSASDGSHVLSTVKCCAGSATLLQLDVLQYLMVLIFVLVYVY